MLSIVFIGSNGRKQRATCEGRGHADAVRYMSRHHPGVYMYRVAPARRRRLPMPMVAADETGTGAAPDMADVMRLYQARNRGGRS